MRGESAGQAAIDRRSPRWQVHCTGCWADSIGLCALDHSRSGVHQCIRTRPAECVRLVDVHLRRWSDTKHRPKKSAAEQRIRVAARFPNETRCTISVDIHVRIRLIRIHWHTFSLWPFEVMPNCGRFILIIPWPRERRLPFPLSRFQRSVPAKLSGTVYTVPIERYHCARFIAAAVRMASSKRTLLFTARSDGRTGAVL